MKSPVRIRLFYILLNNMLLFIKLLFVATVFTSCHFETDGPGDPPRKAGVPADAFWVGKTDGGNWYQVDRVHNHKNSAFIKIFDGETGLLLIEEKYYLICIVKDGLIDKPILIEDLKSQITAFDGEKIHLKRPPGSDSCWLQFF